MAIVKIMVTVIAMVMTISNVMVIVMFMVSVVVFRHGNTIIHAAKSSLCHLIVLKHALIFLS